MPCQPVHECSEPSRGRCRLRRRHAAGQHANGARGSDTLAESIEAHTLRFLMELFTVLLGEGRCEPQWCPCNARGVGMGRVGVPSEQLAHRRTRPTEREHPVARAVVRVVVRAVVAAASAAAAATAAAATTERGDRCGGLVVRSLNDATGWRRRLNRAEATTHRSRGHDSRQVSRRDSMYLEQLHARQSVLVRAVTAALNRLPEHVK